MSPTNITIPTYPAPKREEVPVNHQTAVERSLANPNAFAKPGTIGKPNTGKVRMRLTSVKPKSGRQRMKKRDPRDVKFY